MNKLFLVLTDTNFVQSCVYLEIKDKKAKHLMQTMKLGKKMYESDIIDLINLLESRNNCLLKGKF